MSGQLKIRFEPDDEAAAVWEHTIDTIQRVVAHVGNKEAAFWCDAKPTHFADAIHERDRHALHVQWMLVLLSLLARRTDDTSRALLVELAQALIATSGLRVVDDEPISVEEENAAYRGELSKFGDAGKQAIDRVKRRGGRR